MKKHESTLSISAQAHSIQTEKPRATANIFTHSLPLESHHGVPPHPGHLTRYANLGNKSIRNTLMYTQLVEFKDEDYRARIAHSEAETCQLIESGFEFICDFGSNKVFRKRK